MNTATLDEDLALAELKVAELRALKDRRDLVACLRALADEVDRGEQGSDQLWGMVIDHRIHPTLEAPKRKTGETLTQLVLGCFDDDKLTIREISELLGRPYQSCYQAVKFLTEAGDVTEAGLDLSGNTVGKRPMRYMVARS